MKYFKLIIVFYILLLLAGCWDEEKTPRVVNMSGQDISLQLIFDGKKESFNIDNSDALLLPNLIEEQRLESVNIVAEDGHIITITKRELTDYMNKAYNVFTITEEFSIHAKN